MKTTTPRACHAYFEYMTNYFFGVDECVNLYGTPFGEGINFQKRKKVSFYLLLHVYLIKTTHKLLQQNKIICLLFTNIPT